MSTRELKPRESAIYIEDNSRTYRLFRFNQTQKSRKKIYQIVNLADRPESRYARSICDQSSATLLDDQR